MINEVQALVDNGLPIDRLNYFGLEYKNIHFINYLLKQKSPTNKTLKYLHIPHSDVFYVRTAIEKATGVRYTLEHVEKSMLLEGWKDG